MAQKPSMRAIKNYRWQELGLFIIPFLILLMEMLQLLLARSVRDRINEVVFGPQDFALVARV